jgi:hypothetical protein
MKKITHYVTELVSPVCQKQGFIKASLVLDWPEILGAFSAYCIPLKISFPYNQSTNGRLYVRTTSAMATELTYLEPTILERINQYFGYKAIGKLVIQQGPVPLKPKQKRQKDISHKIREEVEHQVYFIQDEDLKKALFNLGCGILTAHDTLFSNQTRSR